MSPILIYWSIRGFFTKKHISRDGKQTCCGKPIPKYGEIISTPSFRRGDVTCESCDTNFYGGAK